MFVILKYIYEFLWFALFSYELLTNDMLHFLIQIRCTYILFILALISLFHVWNKIALYMALFLCRHGWCPDSTKFVVDASWVWNSFNLLNEFDVTNFDMERPYSLKERHRVSAVLCLVPLRVLGCCIHLLWKHTPALWLFDRSLFAFASRYLLSASSVWLSYYSNARDSKSSGSAFYFLSCVVSHNFCKSYCSLPLQSTWRIGRFSSIGSYKPCRKFVMLKLYIIWIHENS